MFRKIAAALLLAGLAGCATLTGPATQTVYVQAVEGHRPLANVGCLLANDAGRWYVNAPGRVTVRKSNSDLRVACKKNGVAEGVELWHPHYGTDKIIGNALLTAGLGEYADRRSGAGFDYQPTITVLMQAIPAAATAPLNAPANNSVY